MKQKMESEKNQLLVNLEKLMEGPMVLLGFVWLVLIVIEFINGLSRPLEILSLVIWGLFIIDFLLKVLLAPSKKRFLRKNWLLAISLIVPAFRVLRVFRAFRILRGAGTLRLVRLATSLNRGMRSLNATMKKRAFGYIMLLTLVFTLAGAAGMYTLEKGNAGFENYGMALWWTAMRIITAGSDFWPQTAEGRGLAFFLSLFGYAVFGYITAFLASFFIGMDSDKKASESEKKGEIMQLQTEIRELRKLMEQQLRK